MFSFIDSSAPASVSHLAQSSTQMFVVMVRMYLDDNYRSSSFVDSALRCGGGALSLFTVCKQYANALWLKRGGHSATYMPVICTTGTGVVLYPIAAV